MKDRRPRPRPGRRMKGEEEEEKEDGEGELPLILLERREERGRPAKELWTGSCLGFSSIEGAETGGAGLDFVVAEEPATTAEVPAACAGIGDSWALDTGAEDVAKEERAHV